MAFSTFLCVEQIKVAHKSGEGFCFIKMNRKQLKYKNAQDHFLRTIREGGDGTAALEAYQEASDDLRRCSYRHSCDNYTETCLPDTCKHIHKFYMEINRP